MQHLTRTLLLLDSLSNITSTQVIAIAAHKLMSSLTPALSGLEKRLNTMMVITTATNEMEQPTVEMISRASLWLSFICDMYQNNSAIYTRKNKTRLT